MRSAISPVWQLVFLFLLVFTWLYAGRVLASQPYFLTGAIIIIATARPLLSLLLNAGWYLPVSANPGGIACLY